ncbi:MAG: DNA polymerase III [Treponema sp.]|nr:DNA polymerase III [Treponema sp.]
MFENIIGQDAVLQLRDDIVSGCSAPSILFFGPGESGKGSAALELARIHSCEEKAEWKCVCPSCGKHRYLQHEDLLVLGPRSFSAEISACSAAFYNAAFLKNTNTQSAKLLFIRSVRKLMLRFSPVLMEDDPKFSKISSVLQSLDEGLNEFWDKNNLEQAAAEKLNESIIKNAAILEKDGLSSLIQISHIRRASYWCRLAPSGKRKTLILENAENMRDEARNSLLKLLEEPPASVSIVLTAKRREAVMPTILSRLRPYRFLKRDSESEKEVIRRVFQGSGESVSDYLDSFLPQNTEKLYPLAAWFVVSLARIAVISLKRKNNVKIPVFLNTLGERYALIADNAGLPRCVKSAEIIKIIIAKSGNFEEDSFSKFMKICMDLSGSVTFSAEDPEVIAFNDILIKYINEAVTAVDILNINSNIVLESLLYKLKTAIRSQYG